MNVKRIFLICEDKGNCQTQNCPFRNLKNLPKMRAEQILGISIPWYESSLDVQCFKTESELAAIYCELSKISEGTGKMKSDKKQRIINKRLEKFGNCFYSFNEAIWNILKVMSDEELKQVLEDAKTLTTTNVGWGTYNAMPYVCEEIEVELHRRQEKLTKVAEEKP